jgi:hypothetical protein
MVCRHRLVGNGSLAVTDRLWLVDCGQCRLLIRWRLINIGWLGGLVRIVAGGD